MSAKPNSGFLTALAFCLGGGVAAVGEFTIGLWPPSLVPGVIIASYIGLLCLLGGIVSIVRTLFRLSPQRFADLFGDRTEELHVELVPALYRVFGHRASFAPWLSPPTLFLDAGLPLDSGLPVLARYEIWFYGVHLRILRNKGTRKRWGLRFAWDLFVVLGGAFCWFALKSQKPTARGALPAGESP